MGLKRFLPILAFAALCLIVALAPANGNFADADGASGRHGATCTACHVTPHPTAPPAEAFLEGMPDAWEPNQTYLLTLRVTGGPDALPAPAPQGGFEMDVDGGHLLPGPGFAPLMRNPSTESITYLPEGTLMREWQVEWVSPTLARQPAAVQVWLAVMSANGNHVVATNISDSGEKFDNTAAIQLTIPPAPSALEAWNAMPLLAPFIERVETKESGATITGRHPDANATHLSYKVGDGDWMQRQTGTAWRLNVPPLDPGQELQLRAEGFGRVSPPVLAAVGVREGGPVAPDDPQLQKDTPLPLVVTALAVTAAITIRRKSP